MFLKSSFHGGFHLWLITQYMTILSFQLLRPKPWSYPWLSFSPSHPVCQQMLLALLSTYIQIQPLSPAPPLPHWSKIPSLCPGFLQEPLPGFSALPSPLLSSFHSVAKVILSELQSNHITFCSNSATVPSTQPPWSKSQGPDSSLLGPTRFLTTTLLISKLTFPHPTHSQTSMPTSVMFFQQARNIPILGPSHC